MASVRVSITTSRSVAVDRRLTIEQSAEMLDVADADHAPLELLCVGNAQFSQHLADRWIAVTLGVIDRPAVEIEPHRRVGGERDLAGEGVEPGDVE